MRGEIEFVSSRTVRVATDDGLLLQVSFYESAEGHRVEIRKDGNVAKFAIYSSYLTDLLEALDTVPFKYFEMVSRFRTEKSQVHWVAKLLDSLKNGEFPKVADQLKRVTKQVEGLSRTLMSYDDFVAFLDGLLDKPKDGITIHKTYFQCPGDWYHNLYIIDVHRLTQISFIYTERFTIFVGQNRVGAVTDDAYLRGALARYLNGERRAKLLRRFRVEMLREIAKEDDHLENILDKLKELGRMDLYTAITFATLTETE